jgi:histidinol-phosphate aminotransferase
MDALTIELGTAAIEDKAYFEECCEKIIATREWTKEELKKLGFSFGDSKSNFIFATHKDIPAAEIYQALREADIYVRYFGKMERIKNHLRISIGTEEEMRELIDFLTYYVNKCL